MNRVKCHYCGEERPVDDMRKRYLIEKHGSKSGKNSVTKRTLNWYCSDKPCDERDQDRADQKEDV